MSKFETATRPTVAPQTLSRKYRCESISPGVHGPTHGTGHTASAIRTHPCPHHTCIRSDRPLQYRQRDHGGHGNFPVLIRWCGAINTLRDVTAAKIMLPQRPYKKSYVNSHEGDKRDETRRSLAHSNRESLIEYRDDTRRSVHTQTESV